MPHKMQVEAAQPLSRLKDNRNLAVYQLGFFKILHNETD